MRTSHILRLFLIPICKDKHGFSLMEVVIGAGLLGLAVASSFRVYVSNQRLTRYLDQRARAYQIAVQEIEGLRRMQYHHILWIRKKGPYSYKFVGYDDAGEPVKGKDAIVDARGGCVWNKYVETRINNLLTRVDPYKQEHFDPMGLQEGWVYVYMQRVRNTNDADREWAVRVKVVVCWRDGDVVYGGDRNLNGGLDKCERHKCNASGHVVWGGGNYYRGKYWDYWHPEIVGYNDWNRTFKSPVEIETVLAPVL